MNDRFRYRPAEIMVRAGHRVTFDVTNAGKLPHEFILGDRATQLDHERQMQGGSPAGGHGHAHGPSGHAMPAPAAPSPSHPARPGASPGPSTSRGSSSTAATSSATGRPG